ncbi:MAG TPA: Dyp-type peroxidase [Solirubrobacteraceae bacterium]|nr:Dyp-type peroxidase [Solirubrobacteraceae bacterium]
MSVHETMAVPSEMLRDPALFTLPQFGIFAQGTHAHRFLHDAWLWIGGAEPGVTWHGARGAGGSHVLTVPWVHDLVAFNRLSIEDQQRVFGRTKPDSLELPAAEKPPTAHISRVQTTVEGRELEIFRRSGPYGTAAEHGLYFVAFSAARSRYDLMLARMFGNDPDGVRDRLTDFTSPVSGGYYFAPFVNALNGPAGEE